MFKTTAAARGGRNQRNNPYVLDDMFVRFHRSAAGTAWRWRTELTILTAAAAALWRLALLITLTWAAVTLTAFVLILLGVPSTRRFLARRFWCVLGRHRLQRLCYEARLHTRSGRLPLILWTRPTKVGERTHILCRAGICAEDFDAHIGEIRAACYAREARVTRNPRWSQLVTIDVIRRDTLAAKESIPSTLTGLRARHQPVTGQPSSLQPATQNAGAGSPAPATTSSRTNATWPGNRTRPSTPATPASSPAHSGTSTATDGPPPAT